MKSDSIFLVYVFRSEWNLSCDQSEQRKRENVWSPWSFLGAERRKEPAFESKFGARALYVAERVETSSNGKWDRERKTYFVTLRNSQQLTAA